MKRVLQRVKKETYYFVDGERVVGVPNSIQGNLSGIWGDLSGIQGDLSGIQGNLSGIQGDLSGIQGDLSGIQGNLTEAELTDEERAAGVNIADLIKEEA